MTKYLLPLFLLACYDKEITDTALDTAPNTEANSPVFLETSAECTYEGGGMNYFLFETLVQDVSDSRTVVVKVLYTNPYGVEESTWSWSAALLPKGGGLADENGNYSFELYMDIEAQSQADLEEGLSGEMCYRGQAVFTVSNSVGEDINAVVITTTDN